MNIECVASLAAAKYITKYAHKGPNHAMIKIQQCNEVSKFRDCRYVAVSKATWHLFKFPIHHQELPIMSLQVHPSDHHMVVFNPNKSIETITARAMHKKTMLILFFKLNKNHLSVRQYIYQEVLLHFMWDQDKKGLESLTTLFYNWPNVLCVSNSRGTFLSTHPSYIHKRANQLGRSSHL